MSVSLFANFTAFFKSSSSKTVLWGWISCGDLDKQSLNSVCDTLSPASFLGWRRSISVDEKREMAVSAILASPKFNRPLNCGPSRRYFEVWVPWTRMWIFKSVLDKVMEGEVLRPNVEMVPCCNGFYSWPLRYGFHGLPLFVKTTIAEGWRISLK